MTPTTARITLAAALACALGGALAGCPDIPPVTGCQPQAQACIADAPHVCSASQRWHRAGSLTCAAIGGVCTVVGGRAYCAPPAADGGASEGGL